jgi:hypothetical protein
MSVEHSRKLIKEIADRKEADAYFDGMSKWDGLSQEPGIVAPEPTEPMAETELER